MSTPTLNPGVPGRAPIVAQIVASMVIATPIVYMGVVALLRSTGAMPENGYVGLDPNETSMASAIALAAGLIAIAASYVVRAVMAGRLTPENDTITDRMRITIMSLAICDAAAQFGIVLALLAGPQIAAWLLWILSLFGGLLLFPTRTWLEGGSRR